jgi:hypothetical protein
MKPEDQIKALAELAGYIQESGFVEYDGAKLPWKLFINAAGKKHNSTDVKFCYLTSYDAIIPLIQKQTSEVQQRIHNRLQKEIWCCELNPPIKYCEALLRATGKWKE